MKYSQTTSEILSYIILLYDMMSEYLLSYLITKYSAKCTSLVKYLKLFFFSFTDSFYCIVYYFEAEMLFLHSFL